MKFLHFTFLLYFVFFLRCFGFRLAVAYANALYSHIVDHRSDQVHIGSAPMAISRHSNACWSDETDSYLCSVETLTKSALKKIKYDRIRCKFQFNDAFKEWFVGWARIRCVNLKLIILFLYFIIH